MPEVVAISSAPVTQAEELLRRFQELETERKNWTGVWDEVIQYIFPRRTETSYTAAEGTRHDDSIFDGTAPHALQRLASRMQGELVIPSYRWFGLKMESARMMKIPAVKEWLQEVEPILYAMLARSNFYSQMSEYFMDAASFGTATMYSELDRKTGKLQFTTRHPKEVFLGTTLFGAVDKVFRRYEMTARQWVGAFPETVHEKIRDMAKVSPEKQFPCLHAVYPREGRDASKSDAYSMAFASCYLDIEHRSVVKESGYRSMPYHVWRFYKNSDEVYGRSPSWSALPDVKAINLMAKTQLMAAQLAVDPPLWLPEEYRDRIRFVPGGRNYWEGNPENAKIAPIETGSKYGIGKDEIAEKKDQIRNHFMWDLFMFPDENEQERTAYEARLIDEKRSVSLGPTVLVLEHDALDPIIDRVFDIAWNEGWLPPPPQVLIQMYGGRIKVDYMGPLALRMKQFFRNQPFRNTFQEIAPIAQMRPDVMDNFDWDEWVRQVADANDIPIKALLNADVMAQIRKQRAQMQAQQQQIENMSKMGKMPLNEAPKPGSPMEQMSGVSQG